MKPLNITSAEILKDEKRKGLKWGRIPHGKSYRIVGIDFAIAFVEKRAYFPAWKLRGHFDPAGCSHSPL